MQALEARALVPALAATAALGVSVVALRYVLVSRAGQQQRQQPDTRRREGREPLSGGGGGTGWAALASRPPQGFALAWPLQSAEQKKETQLQHTVRAACLDCAAAAALRSATAATHPVPPLPPLLQLRCKKSSGGRCGMHSATCGHGTSA